LGDDNVTQLALGYSNNGTMSVTRPITADTVADGTRNYLLPLAYNGQQIDLFRSGTHVHALVLKDRLQVLQTPGGRIAWVLTNTQLIITAKDLTGENKCQLATQPPSGDTEEDIVTPAPRRGNMCSAENTDCSAYDTFCSGKTRCDLSLGLCLLVDASFSPCDKAPEGVQVDCLEDVKVCLASVSCETNHDCQDSLICNGEEQCINGTCVMQNFTCPAGQVCVEGVGCIVQDLPLSNAALLGVTAAGIFGGAFVILLVYLFFTRAYNQQSQGNNKKEKKKKNKK
jgi:hypothetical protein